jgi:dTDP-4-dehydrorhamnose reductase
LGLNRDNNLRADSTAEKLAKLNPSHIVNCGAYTQVDKAEEEPELANLINAQAVGVIAKFAFGKQIPFVHISTDYVFDGSSTTPYLEEGKINPQSVYGSSKAMGEKEAMENTVIVRDMTTRSQETVKISKLLEYVKNLK